MLSYLYAAISISQVGTAGTYVAIRVTGDITGSIDVKPNVHVKICFDGNVSKSSGHC